MCAFFPAKALSQQPPAPSPSRESGFTIAGVVLQHGTNEPLKHVKVSVIPVEHRDRQLSCISASTGGFTFTGLPAGKYTLQAQFHGFAQAFRGTEDFSTAIVVGPGLDSEHITFLLDAPAAISGTVIDDEGEPVRNAEVFLFHRGIIYGRPRIVMQTQEGTDSSGAFRFGHLRPGMYFVAVSAHPWYAQNLPLVAQSERSSENANASNLDVAYPLTYYADSLDAASASPITLSEGAVAELSMTLRAVPALHLDLNAPPSEGLNLFIFAAGPGNILIPVNTTQFFENTRRGILGLAPGHYVLISKRFEQGSAGAVGREAIDLTANLTLDASELSKTSISGRARVEGSDRADGLALSLVNVNDGRAIAASVAPDGSFKVEDEGLSPGRYEFRLGNTQELYVKSIAVNGAEQSGRIFDIGQGAFVRVSLVIAKGLTRINGIALKGDKPSAGAMVLLLPENLSLATYIPRDQSDSDGTFTLNSVQPGRYTLIAIDDGRDLAYRDPSVIKPYIAQAQIIDVPLQRGAVVQVNVQPRRP